MFTVCLLISECGLSFQLKCNFLLSLQNCLTFSHKKMNDLKIKFCLKFMLMDATYFYLCNRNILIAQSSKKVFSWSKSEDHGQLTNRASILKCKFLNPFWRHWLESTNSSFTSCLLWLILLLFYVLFVQWSIFPSSLF